MKRCLLSLVFLFLAVTPALAEQTLVAVAANFVPPFREVATEFEKATGHTVQVASGPSGGFYTQIKNGAPFDVFFSADNERPKLLEEEGLGVKGSRFTYAIGRLVLWSPDPNLVKGEDTLRSEKFKHLAIANPKTAPYGVAAMQAMQKLGVWEHVQSRLVMGEGLGQTIGFIESGNAELGFLALSQVMDPKMKGKGGRWDVPRNLHEPIQQDVVLLTKGKDNSAANALIEFMRGPQAMAIIERYGYELK
ncbi:MAG: molybdate ABC transporter substrate-binding protein [Nitrospirota bacterium]